MLHIWHIRIATYVEPCLARSHQMRQKQPCCIKSSHDKPHPLCSQNSFSSRQPVEEFVLWSTKPGNTYHLVAHHRGCWQMILGTCFYWTYTARPVETKKESKSVNAVKINVELGSYPVEGECGERSGIGETSLYSYPRYRHFVLVTDDSTHLFRPRRVKLFISSKAYGLLLYY